MMRPLTITEMVAYTLYYRDPQLYWRFARQDTEFMGWLEDAMSLPEHKPNMAEFGRN